MRKLIFLALTLFIFSCSAGSSADSNNSEKEEKSSNTTKVNKAAQEGQRLFNLKCASCHKIDKKLIGPPLKGSLENWGGKKKDLYLWTKNWEAAVEKEIPRALEMVDYDPSVMTLFPELSNKQLDAIYDYIENN